MLLRYLTWAFDHRRFTSGVDFIHGRFVGAALVHRDLLGNTAGLHGFVEEPQDCGLFTSGRQKEVDCLSRPVHGALEVFPGAFDLYVRFIHAPIPIHRMLVFAEYFIKQRQKPDCPAIDQRVVDIHAALLHHLLEMTVAQRTGRVPTDAHQNQVNREAPFFGRQYRVQAFLVKALNMDEQAA